MNEKHDYIAVFDSGVGGISVLRHLRKALPGERFLYFGDSANAPYGSRPTEEVRALTLAAVRYLLSEYPLKALVIACNTATAAAVNDVRAAYPELIVVGIEPALKVAADHFPGGRVGVMATEVTLREEKFDTLLHRFDEDVTICKIPAPGLVELVETGRAHSPETEALLREQGLWKFKDELSTSLPYGLQRRLEIARALATDPKLLLLDEPAAGMNPQETLELAAFISEIRDKYKLSIFLVEHHMDLVMNISDRIYVLDFGKLIAQGVPAEIQSNEKVIDAYLGVSEDE